MVNGGGVGDHIALHDLLSTVYDRALVDGGGIVGAQEFLEFVFRLVAVVIGDLDHVSLHAADLSRLLGDDHVSGIARGTLLTSGAANRRVRLDGWHGLALHVRTHERARGVIVLQKRNERGADRHNLFGRNVHVVDFVLADNFWLSVLTTSDECFDKVSVLINRDGRWDGHRTLFLKCIDKLNLIRHAAQGLAVFSPPSRLCGTAFQ